MKPDDLRREVAMDTSSFYLHTCNQDDVDAFTEWLLSNGFVFARDDSYFRGVIKVYARGPLGVMITCESGMFSFALSNLTNRLHKRVAGSWFSVDDVMELLGAGSITQSDPAKTIRFLKENMDRVQALFESPDLAAVAKCLDQNRIKRYDRIWPKAKPREERSAE